MSSPIDLPVVHGAARGSTFSRQPQGRLCSRSPPKALGLMRLPAEALEVQEHPNRTTETSQPGSLLDRCTEQARDTAWVLQGMCLTPLAT